MPVEPVAQLVDEARRFRRKAVAIGEPRCHELSDPPVRVSEGSRIGGLPFLEHGDSWPLRVDGTQEALRFLFQIDFRPHAAALEFTVPYDLVTVFVGPYGPDPGAVPGPEAHRREVVVRTYVAPVENDRHDRIDPNEEPETHWYELAGFTAAEMIPDFYDLEILSDRLKPDTTPAKHIGGYVTQCRRFAPILSVFGGYPSWVNGYCNMVCHCGRRLVQLAQFDQTDFGGVYLGAGACGILHMFTCTEHVENFYFHRSSMS